MVTNMFTFGSGMLAWMWHLSWRTKKQLMKYLMTAMLAVLLVASATAQETKGKTTQVKSRAELITDRMTQELGLDAEQAKDVQEINAKYAEAALGRSSAKANEESRSGDPVAMQEMNDALKGVLTSSQYEQWMKAQVGGRTTTTPDGRKINAVQEVK